MIVMANVMKERDNYMEPCYFCKALYHSNDMIDAKGELVCEDCAADRCIICSYGDCEVETKSGDYTCMDCYSGACDSAYESMRDSYE